jgi:hypothetical protein
MQGQNYALTWMVYLSRLVEYGHLRFEKSNPKITYMDASSSNVFLCGRDIEGNPFLGVPSSLMPFFTQVDWVDASICRDIGYLFLEAKNPRTLELNMALGIKLRSARMDIFCIKGKEDIQSLRLNIKVFEASPDNSKEVIFADRHELVGISLREIDSPMELGEDNDASDAASLLSKSGLGDSYTVSYLDM